jgi:hypothetical protein
MTLYSEVLTVRFTVFKIHELCSLLTHYIHAFRMILTTNIDFFSLNSVNGLIFVVETLLVYC